MKLLRARVLLLVLVAVIAALAVAGPASAGWTWDEAVCGWTWDDTAVDGGVEHTAPPG